MHVEASRRSQTTAFAQESCRARGSATLLQLITQLKGSVKTAERALHEQYVMEWRQAVNGYGDRVLASIEAEPPCVGMVFHPKQHMAVFAYQHGNKRQAPESAIDEWVPGLVQFPITVEFSVGAKYHYDGDECLVIDGLGPLRPATVKIEGGETAHKCAGFVWAAVQAALKQFVLEQECKLRNLCYAMQEWFDDDGFYGDITLFVVIPRVCFDGDCLQEL